MTGTVTVVESSAGTLRKVSFTWTATGGGAASATSRYRYTGNILAVCTVPSSDVAPTAAYDITLTDDSSVDVANGQLINRSATATEWVTASLGVIVRDYVTLNVAAAGSGGKGVTHVFIGSEVADNTLIKNALYGTAGIASWAAGAAPANDVSLAEAVRYISDKVAPGYGNGRYLAVTATMSSATWNTVAKHEVFTVTGTVRMQMWITCGATLVDAGDAAIIEFGHESDTDAFIAKTDAAGRNATTITTGWLWYNTTPVAGPAPAGSAVMDYVVNGGLDVGYEISGAALTGGSLVFHCVWEPLDATGAVVAGAGGVL
jgi:hypothetical protein